MSTDFSLQGRWQATPKLASVSASGCPTIGAQFAEGIILAKRHYTEPTLDADAVEAVSFGDVTSAHVVLIKSDKKVTVRLTSVEGAIQIVPVDTLLYLISESVPYTAIDLTRVAGQSTTVKILLGEKT